VEWQTACKVLRLKATNNIGLLKMNEDNGHAAEQEMNGKTMCEKNFIP